MLANKSAVLVRDVIETEGTADSAASKPEKARKASG